MDHRTILCIAASVIAATSIAPALGGCTVIAVTGAAVSVASTAVGAAATVVGTGVDAATGAVKAVAGSGDKPK